MWVFSDAFSPSMEIITSLFVFFLFPSATLVNYIDFFILSVKSTLHSWNKSYLVVMCYPLYRPLDSVS